jgi:chitinase
MKNFSSSIVLFICLLFTTQSFSQFCDMYVGGYVPSYRAAGAIDYSKVSHVFYAFAGADPAGNLILDSSIYGNFSAFKAATVGKNRYLSLEGGDTVHTIKTMANSPSARSNFVSQCVSFCSANGFSGIDMDWENIDNSTDSSNFYSLVSALSTSLHTNGYELIITLSYNYNARYYGVASLNKADWIQLMVYDETGWGPGSPYGNHSGFESMENAIAYWNNKGYTDRSKIVIGLPFYGYQFSSYAGGTGTPKTYSEITASNPNLKTDEDSLTLTPFNSAALLKRKVDHVKFSGLKGVFVWELGQDLPSTNTKSLLRAISDAACDQNPLWADYGTDNAVNLALNTPVESSSGPGNVSKIVDNNGSTYWTSSSSNGDTAWIHVDLGSTYDISKVEILWEQTGIGRDFEIKVASSSTGDWTTIQQRFYNSSLTSTLNGLKGTGRYVSIQGLSRGCNSRYKIAEFRVYGSAVSGSRYAASPTPPKAQPAVLPVGKKMEATTSSFKIFPNPASHTLTVDMTRVSGGVQRLELLDNMGKQLRSIQVRSKTTETIDIRSLPAGFYLLRAVTNAQQAETQKVLIRH